jgi:hypothetical protein
MKFKKKLQNVRQKISTLTPEERIIVRNINFENPNNKPTKSKSNDKSARTSDRSKSMR